jgi:histidine triad (HIT) family protein
MSDCLFCKIIAGELPSKKLYEDDEALAFHDIYPVAPVHFMIVPKRHIDKLADCKESDAPILGKLLALVPRLAREQGLHDGFRTVINTGRVGRQDVYHLHIHVMGGPEPLWTMAGKE